MLHSQTGKTVVGDCSMTKIMATVYMHTCSLLTINSDTGENCTSVDEKVPLTTYIQSLARLIAMCWQSVRIYRLPTTR